MKKLTYIISNIDKAIAFEWICEAINQEKFDISFVLLNPTPNTHIQSYLKKKNISFLYIHYSGKKDILNTFYRIYKYLLQNQPDIIHCHLFEASFLGLLSGKLAGIKKRIFTRHHSTYNHIYHQKKVYRDKIVNSLATHIVSISQNVSNILIEKENVNPSKITLIHHGFKLSDFYNLDKSKIENLKKKYKTYTNHPIIGVIARYTHWKGIQYIIPAFKETLKKYPNAKLVLANANGNYSNKIKKLLKDIPKENYIEIVFEKDLFSLYQLFDIYIHAPIDNSVEAFGQTYVEALAAGIPSIFTLSGVANEFIKNKQNALVVDYKNSKQINDSIEKLLTNSTIRNQISITGQESVKELFNLEKMISKLETIYEN